MRRFRWWAVLLLVPALAVPLTLGGCGSDNKPRKSKPKRTDDDERDDDKGGAAEGTPPGGGGEAVEERTELPSTGWGTLRGTVFVEGDPPVPKVIQQAKEHKDHLVCEGGDITEQAWRVKEKEGKKVVANVAVWLRAPEGKCFKMPPEDKKFWRNEVVIHQPHCAFEPHVDVAFPSYYDPKQKKMVATGQVLKVDNSSPILHNTRWKGDDLVNPGASLSLSAGNKGITLNVKPDKVPITLNCDLHKWMSGYVWALDHPYAAVTDKDGNYEIKNVPAGVDLQIVCWHEGTYVNGPKGITVKFEADKENKQDFTIKGK